MEIIQDGLMVLGGIAALVAIAGALIAAYKWWIWHRRLTWDDVLRVADELLEQIEAEGESFDLVIGLGRSGGIWGGWLAGNLGSLPFCAVDDKYRYANGVDDKYGNANGTTHVEFPPGTSETLLAQRARIADGARVLIVQGATGNGQTFKRFLDEFREELNVWVVKTAVLYRNAASSFGVDFVGERNLIPWPTNTRPFPWQSRAAYRPFLADAPTGRRLRLAVIRR